MSVDLRLTGWLAYGAYHLDARETEGPGLNSGNAGADRAYLSAATRVQFLGADDVSVRTGSTKYGANGLENGIYTRANAAALVGRDDDGTLYIAFRGTNDTKGSSLFRTPDESHWFNKDDHYALFAPLIAGLDAYAAENGIRKLVITGHSLGASMVEALADEIRDTGLFGGVEVEAVNFASPGYAGAGNANPVLTTFNLRGDVVPLGATFSNNAGDENWVYHNIETGIHAMSLHAAVLAFFADNGLTLADFNDLHGIDYDRILLKVPGAARDTGGKDPETSAFVIGQGQNTITGSQDNDLILGGDGNDTLSGDKGNDYLDGGANNDEMFGGPGEDRMFGHHGLDTLKGGRDADVLLGGAHRDTLRGQHGHDFLAGESGDDSLKGGAGRDTLFGGRGRDILTGGADADVFVFRNDGSTDLVKDFSANDLLVVEANIDSVTRAYADGSTTLGLYDGDSFEYAVDLKGQFSKAYLLARLDTQGLDAALVPYADDLLG